MIPFRMPHLRKKAGGGLVVPAAYQYNFYRITTSANNGDTYVGLGELYGYETVGGPDVLIDKPAASVGVFSAGSVLGGYPASAPFNQADSRKACIGWVNTGANNDYLRFQSTAGAIRVKALGLASMPGEQARMPSQLKVRYSDNGSTWSDAISLVAIPAWTSGEFRYYAVPNVGAHTYWEYTEVLNQGGGAYCSLGVCVMVLDNGELIRAGTRNVRMREGTRFNDSYPLADVLDRNTGYWVSSGGVIQTIEWITPVSLAEFGFKCFEPNRMPRDFVVDGYNADTQAWIRLRTITGATGWAINEIRKYSLTL